MSWARQTWIEMGQDFAAEHGGTSYVPLPATIVNTPAPQLVTADAAARAHGRFAAEAPGKPGDMEKKP